jgi:hypothetical protein
VSDRNADASSHQFASPLLPSLTTSTSAVSVAMYNHTSNRLWYAISLAQHTNTTISVLALH